MFQNRSSSTIAKLGHKDEKTKATDDRKNKKKKESMYNIFSNL
jgi:hypothetical protein